jgi:hypothetical protein
MPLTEASPAIIEHIASVAEFPSPAQVMDACDHSGTQQRHVEAIRH